MKNIIIVLKHDYQVELKNYDLIISPSEFNIENAQKISSVYKEGYIYYNKEIYNSMLESAIDYVYRNYEDFDLTVVGEKQDINVFYAPNNLKINYIA